MMLESRVVDVRVRGGALGQAPDGLICNGVRKAPNVLFHVHTYRFG